MTSSLILFTIVTAPFLLFILQGIIIRLLALFGMRDLSPQLGAVISATLLNISIILGLFIKHNVIWSDSSSYEILAGAIFILASLDAMCLVYFQLVNVLLTSIHMQIISSVYMDDGLPVRKLEAVYGTDHMISTRLERLIKLGQIRVEGNRVLLNSIILVVLSAPLYFWRNILGLKGEV